MQLYRFEIAVGERDWLLSNYPPPAIHYVGEPYKNWRGEMVFDCLAEDSMVATLTVLYGQLGIKL